MFARPLIGLVQEFDWLPLNPVSLYHSAVQFPTMTPLVVLHEFELSVLLLIRLYSL